MTDELVALDELLAARERLIQTLHRGLDDVERRFLLSLIGAQPDWSLLGLPHLQDLPGIRWKL
jgi:hypothetical protein